MGNARTALFNWLFARHHAGSFVLRIEDTDAERSKAEYERQLIDDLRWFGIEWDEGPDQGGRFGPYRQSERKDLYRRHATQLIDSGRAYFCFCTAEQLEAERQEALKAGRQPMYSGRCRKLPREETKIAEGRPAAVRLKVEGGAFAWKDLVHGATVFPGDVIGDFILVRSDGNPAYNFAVVIDDHLMEITHVIRGDDHISNTPRQLALYQALDWTPPQFAHLSTILGPDRARLSKRHGATSLQNFREMGILPEALRNYLALLGWSPRDGVTEILGPQELVAQFSLEGITKSPAVFDQEKLNWMNRHYLKESSPRRLALLAVPFLARAGYLADSRGGEAPEVVLTWIERILEAVLKNVSTLAELPSAARLIFEYDARTAVASGIAEDGGAREVLKAFIPKVTALEEVTYAQFREAAKVTQKETGRKAKDLFHPIRVALTGADSGPELEKLVPLLGEGAKLDLARPVKSAAERLREFAEAAKLF